jgi:hypothetical protein
MARISGFLKRLFHHSSAPTAEAPRNDAEPRNARTSAPAKARPVRREADIPLDVIEHAYTPPLTSSKASFRSDGSDHQRDQEFVLDGADDRWKDEDRFTNKSGDPRIGTHRRNRETDESRAETRE